ncbi:4Fe-4S dicluster domain-containing protein [Candidatus Auribacterota bacterium]
MSFFSMTKTVIKSMTRRPATRKFPFAPQRTPYDNTRGSISNDTANCVFCGLCQIKCPTNAIIVDRKEKKWDIDRLRCIVCGCCVEHCPKKCLKMENEYTKPSIRK